MARNILLTSLSAAENDLPLQYFSVQNETGFNYCDSLLDAEAGIKTLLARHEIDEIIVIGRDNTYDEKDELDPVPIRDGSRLYSEDLTAFSTYRLLKYRIARYADELPPDRRKEDELLPADVREKLVRFIRDYQEGSRELRDRKINRLFDVLSQSDQAYEDFRDALFDAFPDLRECQEPCLRWVRNYLYTELKPSAWMELLPANGKTSICLIPEDNVEDGSLWARNLMAMKDSIIRDDQDINLYVSLNGEDAADNFIVINLLDLLIAMPESGVRLKKLYTLTSLQRSMTGIIRDDTRGFGVAELFHAIHSFLNYGKADLIAKIWEDSGEHNDSVAGMVYAMRHVDVGLSMCNIPEVEDGIVRLRELFRDEKFWRESGSYGLIFSVIAESIREDYGPLLDGDGGISFIELVKWAYRHQFYQQTLTLIEARAPENLVRSGIFYYCNDEQQKGRIIDLLVEQRQNLKPYEYYKMDQIDHYFIKTYNRIGARGRGDRNEDPQRVYAALRTESVRNTDPSLITGYTDCDSMETLENLLYAYYHIGNVRNKISHAETQAISGTRLMTADSDESSALVWMRDGIDYFIDSFEKAMDQVQGKNPQIVLITGDEVRSAAERARYRKDKNH